MDLLGPRRPSETVASGHCCAERANECIARQACEGAHQQWARAAPDVAHAAPNVILVAGCSHVHLMCTTPNLLLKHLDATVTTYKRRQMKHLKQTSETLAKTPENIYKLLQTYVTSR
jgi:hypothetical protein